MSRQPHQRVWGVENGALCKKKNGEHRHPAHQRQEGNFDNGKKKKGPKLTTSRNTSLFVTSSDFSPTTLHTVDCSYGTSHFIHPPRPVPHGQQQCLALHATSHFTSVSRYLSARVHVSSLPGLSTMGSPPTMGVAAPRAPAPASWVVVMR